MEAPRSTPLVFRQPASTNEGFDPIFIVGHPRSGTTMLARIFDRHSNFAVPTETFFFVPAHRHRLRLAERAGTHQAFMDYLRGIGIIRYSEESVWDRFVLGPATSFDLFRCLLQDYASCRGKPRCGEKTPWHLLAVPKLLSAYPCQGNLLDQGRSRRGGVVL